MWKIRWEQLIRGRVPSITVEWNEKLKGEEAMNTVRKKLDVSKAAIENVKKIHWQKILVSCHSVGEIDKVEKVLKSCTDFTGKVGSFKKPMIKIISIENKYTKESLAAEIKSRNEIQDNNTRINHTYSTRAEERMINVLAEVSKKVYTEVMQNKYLYIGWQRCKVYMMSII